MNERIKYLVENAENNATAKPRTHMGGMTAIGYSTTIEACADVLALCEAVREIDAQRQKEYAAYEWLMTKVQDQLRDWQRLVADPDLIGDEYRNGIRYCIKWLKKALKA